MDLHSGKPPVSYTDVEGENLTLKKTQATLRIIAHIAGIMALGAALLIMVACPNAIAPGTDGYSVSYNANGATGGSAPVDSAIYNEGDTVTLKTAETLVKAGHAFSGWNSAADGSGTTMGASSTLTMGAANLELWAKWTALMNTLSFNANGGTGSMTDQSIAQGASAFLNANSFTRDGYSFQGWNTAANGSGTAYTPGASYSMGAQSDTLYAQWQANSYQLSFNANSSAATGSVASMNVNCDATVVLPANDFSLAGYIFAGWTTNADGSGSSYAAGASFTMGPADSTLWAKWTPNANNISFNANGGSGSMPDQVLNTGATAPLSANVFTRTGYTFLGWNSASNGSGATWTNEASYTMGPASVVLFAQWQAQIFTLTFLSNGGSGTMSAMSIACDASAALTSNAFSRAGYSFDSWNTLQDGTGQSYANQENFTMGAANRSLWAIWTPNLNRISFRANGGTGSMDDQLIPTNGIANLDTCGFTPPGNHIFLRWTSNEDGSGSQYGQGASFTMGTADTELFAQWEATSYLLSFNANNASAAGSMASSYVDIDATIQLPYCEFYFPSYDYSFVGWTSNSDGSGTGYADAASFTMGTANTTLWARWTPRDNYVAFNANGGSGSMSDIYIDTYSSANLPINTFTREGYTFLGWSFNFSGYDTFFNDGDNYNMGHSSRVLFAIWAANGVNYHANGGTGASAPQFLAQGESVNLRSNTFTRSNFHFTSWNTMPDGNGTSYSAGSSYTLTSPYVILYASWEGNDVALSFDANGGDAPSFSSKTVTYASTYGALPTISRAGLYTFEGWWTGTGGTGTQVTETSAVTNPAAHTLYAKWLKGSLLSLNKTTTVSGYESAGTMGPKAVDGDTATRWSSAAGVTPAWIYVDLETAPNITRISLNFEAGSGAYSLQYSDDASSWTDIMTGGSTGNNIIYNLDLVTEVNARYIRFYSTVNSGYAGNVSLKEFSVYGY